MQTPQGHLTYCTNIHRGESWKEHFAELQAHIPQVKKNLSPHEPFGIGLRLANAASLELRKQENFEAFRQWLDDNNCYVFTMNGFPYGNFHGKVVKDMVHAPDWLSSDRVSYTIRLAQILAALLPEGADGGISTAPLTYRFWHKEEDLPGVFETATLNLLQVVEQLVKIRETTGKLIHIDVEPEPDGLLGDAKEFLDWYLKYLIPLGVPFIQEKFGYNEDVAAATIREHIQLCYDICHFAISYEDHASMISHLAANGIKTGKIQISAALKANLPGDPDKRAEVQSAFERFNEPVYLHQVVARTASGEYLKYADMPEALADIRNPGVQEWRAHFHVPLFIENYDLLQSTQQDIRQVMAIHNRRPFSFHLEVETYTWEVLPDEAKLPLTDSIVREMQWVIDLLTSQPTPSVSYA